MIDNLTEALWADGYVVVPDAVDTEHVAAARTDLEALLEVTPGGRDDFEGRKTKRVYGLFAKTRTLDAMATHPLVLEVLEQVLGSYELSAPAAISIGPGEGAQPLHPDDAIYPLPRPHPEARGERHVAPRGLHRGERRDPDRPRQPPLGGRATWSRHRDARHRIGRGKCSPLPGKRLARWRRQSKRGSTLGGCSPLCRCMAQARREPCVGRSTRAGSAPAGPSARAVGLQHLPAVHRLCRRTPPSETAHEQRR